MSRKIARESAYKLIFEYLFNGVFNGSTLEILMLDEELDEDNRSYIKTVYTGVIDHFDELNSVIASFAIGYSPERIIKADKAALMLAIYEMKYTDIPMSVSINEAVDLVKRYSTEKSSSFVNGILASVYKKLKENENG
jgi:N utilization substance protein B